MHFGNDCIAIGSRNKFRHKYEPEQLEYFSPQQNSQTDLFLIFHMKLPKHIFTPEIIPHRREIQRDRIEAACFTQTH
jgi:hypothetical protein